MAIYDIDGDQIFPKGGFGVVTIAASNSDTTDKGKADFVCTGTNDQTVIQNAIDSFGDKSGVILLCNGTYNISSFTQHDGYYYGLYLPHKKREIIIKGFNHNHKANNSSFSTTDNAAVLNVTSSAFSALPSDTESYVIGSDRSWEFPYKVLGLEDITIAIPNYTKPVIGVDGAYMACMHIDHCFFKTSGDYSDPSGINEKCIAIRGCPQGNIGYNYYFHHIKIIGWGTGFHVAGEALQLVDVQVQRAAYGFVIGNASFLNDFPRGVSLHPMTMIACGASYCTNVAVYFGTGSNASVTIIDFNSEVGVVGGWSSNTLFQYASNGTIRGEITYRLLSCTNWTPADVNIWGSDHSADQYFKTTNLHSLKKGTTANRPSDPCFGAEYYDTTISKFVRFNGTSWVEL